MISNSRISYFQLALLGMIIFMFQSVVVAAPAPPLACANPACTTASSYDLTLGGTRAIPSIVSGIQFATEPAITTTVQVFNDSQLASELSSPNGKRIQIRGPSSGGSANYSTQVFFNSGAFQDIWLEMDNDVTLTSMVYLGHWDNHSNRPERVKITGGNIVTGGDFAVRYVSMDDLIIDNVYIAGQIGIHIGEQIRRFTLINSTLEGTGGGWGMMQVVGYGHSDGRIIQDFIIANCRFFTTNGAGEGAGPWRQWGGHQRFAMVDSYVDRGGAQSIMRYHGDSTNWWFENNAWVSTAAPTAWAQLKFDPDGGTPPPTPDANFPLGPGRILNNKVWHRTWDGPAANNYFSIGGSGLGQSFLNDIVFSGNRVFAVGQTGYAGVTAVSSTVNSLVATSNNLVYSADQPQYEAEPSPLSYGADH